MTSTARSSTPSPGTAWAFLPKKSPVWAPVRTQAALLQKMLGRPVSNFDADTAVALWAFKAAIEKGGFTRLGDQHRARDEDQRSRYAGWPHPALEDEPPRESSCPVNSTRRGKSRAAEPARFSERRSAELPNNGPVPADASRRRLRHRRFHRRRRDTPLRADEPGRIVADTAVHPGRPALFFEGETSRTASSTGAPPWRPPRSRRGRRPGRPRRAQAAERARVRRRVLRRAAGRRGRRAAERPARPARGRGAAARGDARHASSTDAAFGEASRRRGRRARRRRAGRDPLHLGHVRPPEGRRPDARRHPRRGRNAADALALRPDDVVLGAAPFSHVLGSRPGSSRPSSPAPRSRSSRASTPEATLATMAATRTTVLLGVPTMCIALCQAARGADALPPLRIAHVGGAAVPVEVARDFERRSAASVDEGYGLTELCGIATTYGVGQPRKPGSVGMPLGDTELRIAEPDERGVGEVQFRGPSVDPRLLEDDEATARGDRRRRLARDRRPRLRRRRRLPVPRRPQEGPDHPRRLQRLPARGRGGALRAPGRARGGRGRRPARDARRGGRRARRAPAGRARLAEELQAWAKERVAAYKYPRRVVLVDALPKGPTGKILKRRSI